MGERGRERENASTLFICRLFVVLSWCFFFSFDDVFFSLSLSFVFIRLEKKHQGAHFFLSLSHTRLALPALRSDVGRLLDAVGRRGRGGRSRSRRGRRRLLGRRRRDEAERARLLLGEAQAVLEHVLRDRDADDALLFFSSSSSSVAGRGARGCFFFFFLFGFFVNKKLFVWFRLKRRGRRTVSREKKRKEKEKNRNKKTDSLFLLPLPFRSPSARSPWRSLDMSTESCPVVIGRATKKEEEKTSRQDFLLSFFLFLFVFLQK